jgi:hypothetical protein
MPDVKMETMTVVLKDRGKWNCKRGREGTGTKRKGTNKSQERYVKNQ